ncbi:hypothetical protein ACUXCP_001815, partial [Staphylococcus haemolyticus]
LIIIEVIAPFLYSNIKIGLMIFSHQSNLL